MRSHPNRGVPCNDSHPLVANERILRKRSCMHACEPLHTMCFQVEFLSTSRERKRLEIRQFSCAFILK